MFKILKTFSFVALSERVVLFPVAVFSTTVTREVHFLVNFPGDLVSSCGI